MDQNAISDLRTISPEQQNMLSVWQQHLHAEFILKDADATLATMMDHPYVFFVPLGTGRIGRLAVREFYAKTFLPNIPPNLEVNQLSVTIGADRIVEEMVVQFTHTTKMDWILPGLRPTNRRIEIPAVVIVGFEAGKSPTSGFTGITPLCSPRWVSWITRWRRRELKRPHSF